MERELFFDFRRLRFSENNTAAVIAQNQLVIDVYLWPSYCAEVITMNLNVEGSDVSVSVSSSSN